MNADCSMCIRISNRVHQRTFGAVWRWAGTFRRRSTNIGIGIGIGIEPHLITSQLRLTLDEARDWHEHEVFEPPEIAVRLHHRLVAVHPYPNGNGRYSRFMADVYLRLQGVPRLPRGGGRIGETSATRRAYIDALRDADRGDYGPLLEAASE